MAYILANNGWYPPIANQGDYSNPRDPIFNTDRTFAYVLKSYIPNWQKLACPKNQRVRRIEPNDSPHRSGYRPLYLGGGFNENRYGTSGQRWGGRAMRSRGSKIRMGSVSSVFTGSPGGTPEQLLISYGDVNWDPVTASLPYFVESSDDSFGTDDNGYPDWRGCAPGNMVVLHQRGTVMNFMSAGLGIYTVDFRAIPPNNLRADLAAVGGVAGQQWYFMAQPWFRYEWPFNATRQAAGNLLGGNN